MYKSIFKRKQPKNITKEQEEELKRIKEMIADRAIDEALYERAK